MPPELFMCLKNGVIAPDKWEDFPHHYGKSEKIKENLLKSRVYFLRDDKSNAYFYLGVALHYIQDSYTSMASFYPNHHRWEESIEYCNFTDDLEQTINYSLRNNPWERSRCLGIACALSQKAQGKDSTLYMATLTGHEKSASFAEPNVDLNLALRASFVVVESVLSSKNSPELENKLRRLLLDYELLLQKIEDEFSEIIVKLVNELTGLEKRKLPSAGFMPKIKNLLLEIRISLKKSAVNSSYNRYLEQRHLTRFVKEYHEAVVRTVYPYSGWYNFLIPPLNLDVVRRELLPINRVAEVLGINEEVINESLDRFKVSSYQIENTKLVTRTDLDRFLTYSNVNGFLKYPM